MKVKALQKGTAAWANVIATRIVAAKYAVEVEAIRAELMYAYADGFLEGREDVKKKRKS